MSHENDFHLEAPLYAPCLEVLPPPRSADRDLAICDEKRLRIAVLEKSKKAWLWRRLRDTTRNGMRSVCLGRSETNADQVTVVHRDGRRVNVRTESRKKYDQIGVEQLVPDIDHSAVALRYPEGAPPEPCSSRTL